MSRFSVLRWHTLHRLLVLVLSGKLSWCRTLAGLHESGEVIVPEGIHLVFLSPYSPELQPCERMWPLSNEVIANRRFQNLDELQEVQAQQCVLLAVRSTLLSRRHTLL